jgi:hypothetical protein
MVTWPAVAFFSITPHDAFYRRLVKKRSVGTLFKGDSLLRDYGRKVNVHRERPIVYKAVLNKSFRQTNGSKHS